MKSHQNNGYTLIELMVVVTITGVLASAAYSAFNGYTAEADRAQVKADIYELAQIFEREFTDTRDFTNVAAADITAINNRNNEYTITTPVATALTYTIQAIVSNSRDIYDLRLDNIGSEGFKLTTSGGWTDTGWENIP